MNEKQQKKIDRFVRIVDDGGTSKDIAIMEAYDELENKVDSVLEEFSVIKAFENGEPGKDGEDYVLTEEDKEEIAAKITPPVVEKIIEKTERVIVEKPKEVIREIVREIPIVTNEIKEVAVLDPNALPQYGEKFRDGLELLNGDERLDIKSLKGVEENNAELLKDILNRTHGMNTRGVNRVFDGGASASTTGGASAFTDLTDVPSSYTGQGTKFVRVNAGETALEFATVAGGGDALTSAPLSQFAATTSLQLKGVMSDETGSGALVFAESPTLVTPALGTPSALVGTNITGTAAGLTAGTVTTNANLTGHVTSVGNTTSLGSFTVAQLNTAISDADVATGGGTATGTNTGDNATNTQYSGLVTNATHTGDATGATALTVVGLNGTSLAGLATGVLKNTTTTGVPFISKVALTEPATAATLTIANNQTLTVNGSATITNGTHSGTNTGDQTNITGNAATVTTNANLTGHVTSVGNAAVLGSFTKAQLDTAVSDGNVLYVGDVTQYTDELAQDAVGGMVDTSLVYVDATPLLTRAALTGDVTASQGSNATTVKNNLKASSLIMVVGDGANAISANATSASIVCPFSGTIVGYSISLGTSDASAPSGTCTLKTWKKATGTAVPTIADVISTSGVALSTGTNVRSSTVTDFTTTTVTAGDILIVQATATSGCKAISFGLEILKS